MRIKLRASDAALIQGVLKHVTHFHPTVWLDHVQRFNGLDDFSPASFFGLDGVQQGGVIVEASTFNETTKLGHWYGALKAEKDNYFSGKKYNSRGGYITGSYSWINGNCGDVDAQKFRGRGFKMLTGLNTYSSYWVYRGWLSKNDFDKYWWDDPEYKKKIQPV